MIHDPKVEEANYRLLNAAAASTYSDMVETGNGNRQDNFEKESEMKLKLNKKEDEEDGVDTNIMMKDPLSHLLMAAMFCTTVGGMYLSATYKSYGETELTDDKYFALLGSAGSVFNGLSRIFWGGLADKLGLFETMLCNAVLFPILFLSYNYSVKSEPAYAFFVCACFFVYGGNYALYPAATCRLFGSEFAGKNYGLIFSLYGTATAVIMYVLGTTQIPFDSINLMVLGLALIGLTLSFCLRRKAHKLNKE